MVQQILNPFVKLENYNCFGCNENNPYGLKLKFFRHQQSLFAVWHPHTNMQGYFNIVHGGIQATILDEVGVWWVYILGKTVGVTSRMQVKFGKALRLSEKPVVAEANLEAVRRQVYTVSVKLYNAEKEVCAQGSMDYYTFSEAVSRVDYHYPDYDDFLGKKLTAEEAGLADYILL
ncbi:MAG: PaaI family thioesterase [Bacteroidales bacterium]|nr:PaaI family thioesterase [Bacteroidales bacterium]